MLQTFTIAKCRADDAELILGSAYSFTIAEEYEYPAETRSHPVTGTTHIPASGLHLPVTTFAIPLQGNDHFLAAAQRTLNENRYEDFRLVTEDGREIPAPIQNITGDDRGGVRLTVQPQL